VAISGQASNTGGDNQPLKERVEAVVEKLRPGLEGCDVAVRGIRGDEVTVDVFVPGCGTSLSKPVVVDLLKEELQADVPEIRNVVVL